jgi:hypothetical protein
MKILCIVGTWRPELEQARISELRTGNEEENIDRDLIWAAIPEFTRKTWRKPEYL